MCIRFKSASSVCLLVMVAPLAGQNVYVVDDDPGPGVDLPEIAAAVESSADGDVILVRDGFYDAFVIDGKSVTVQAEVGARVVIEPDLGETGVTIQNLPPGGEVFVRGLEVLGASVLVPTPNVVLTQNNGVIWLEECAIGLPLDNTLLGVRIHNCSGVTLSECRVESTGTDGLTYGEAGVFTASNVSAYDSTFIGASGFGNLFLPKADGANGVRIAGGSMFAAGCVFKAGDGGSDPFGSAPGGDGGDGLVLTGNALLRERECTMIAGFAGTGSSSGMPGVPTVVAAGSTLIDVPGPATSLRLHSPVRAGVDDFIQDFVGQPGDQVFLFYSFDGQIPGVYLPIVSGTLVIDPNLFGSMIGTIDGTGTITRVTPSAPFPAGVDAALLTGQGGFLVAGAGLFLSSPSLATSVAPGF